MLEVRLAKIKTRDGVSLDGIVALPKRREKKALVFIHGLGSNFYSGPKLLDALIGAALRNRIAFASFNTRGHDTVTRATKGRRRIFAGMGFERFRECVYDIDAMVRFLWRMGYREIILAGHSTGANKALYYMFRKRDRRVRRLALLGPLSDVVVKKQELKKKFKPILQEVRKIARRRGAESLLPAEIFARRNVRPPIMTANRYLSLYTPGSPEDVFPYANPDARWKELRRVRVPIAVILGSRDELLDRPAKQFIEIFRANARSTKSFSGIIIKGGRHSFQKKERELARTIVNWIKKTKV